MTILTIDIGSTSVRCGIYDSRGRRIAGLEASAATGIRTAADGTSEVCADQLRDTCWRCVDEVLQATRPHTGDIDAVAVCTFAGNVLGIDAGEQAVTPLITYADSRAHEDARRLARETDEDAVHRRTGCYLHTSYLPARLRWLAHTQPRLFSRVSRWITIGEYLELALFGQAAVSYSLASWNGLLDRGRLCWDEELLSLLPVEAEQLSPLTDITAPRRGVRPLFASRWPALSRIPWFPAVGDGAAANIGSGCFNAGQAAITVGTSAAVRAVQDAPVDEPPPGLWCYLIDKRRPLVGGALNEGGSVFAWLKNTLSTPSPDEVEDLLAAMEPDTHGLTFLPFLHGERSPGWAGGVRGAVYGLSASTTPLEILRAGLEAVAYRLYLVYRALRSGLRPRHEIIAGGGALRGSAAWLQIICDVLGQPIRLCREQEVSSRGAALLALESLGLIQHLAKTAPPAYRIFFPDLKRHARYRRAVERQQDLYQALVHDRLPTVGRQ